MAPAESVILGPGLLLPSTKSAKEVAIARSLKIHTASAPHHHRSAVNGSRQSCALALNRVVRMSGWYASFAPGPRSGFNQTVTRSSSPGTYWILNTIVTPTPRLGIFDRKPKWPTPAWR